jgi:hypothetical protein
MSQNNAVPSQPASASLANLRRLDDGLVLRRSTAQDVEALAAFNASLHSDAGPDQPDERIANWTRDFFLAPHPTTSVNDFTIVEDLRTGKIVSTLNLISQTWNYAGIPFGVGRPELVGTLPEYRNRGLVRAQFEIVHGWSAERGQQVQAITGIPYYYRLFGYEMALNLGGGRFGYKPHVPVLKPGETEPFIIRAAVGQDVPFVDQLHRQASRRGLVSCEWNEAIWEFELLHRSQGSINRLALKIIERASGERVGFFTQPAFLWWDRAMPATIYELLPGISWGAVTPSVIRSLYSSGEALAAEKGKQASFCSFGLHLGVEHPAYQTLHSSLPDVHKPYAWYLRLPDLPGFLRQIAPALESRLAASPYAGHTGELRISFYRSGLLLGLEAGKLVRIEPWKPAPQGHSGEAAFPELTFLQLVFGYRSFEELHFAFADCWWEDDCSFGLLTALFPKQASDVFPVA